MRITVVTPFFNGSRFFGDTVQSLLAQTHEDWEWIIVDDGSEPKELEALGAWCQSDDRLNWQPRKGGPKGANRCRNQGWKHASAGHILFLDSDDMLLPHCLEQRVAHSLESSLQAGEIPYFGTLAFQEGEDGCWLWDDPNHPASWLASLWSQTPPCQSSGPLWTKTALEMVGGWSEDIHVWQDIDIHQRAHFHGIHFIPSETREPDVLYRIHDKSLSHAEFHGAEKLQSRAAILQGAHQYARSGAIEAEEILALSSMTWSVFRNACLLRNWSLADDVIEAASHIPGFPMDFLKRWKQNTTWRLNRIPGIQQRMDAQAHSLFPKIERSILSTPYP